MKIRGGFVSNSSSSSFVVFSKRALSVDFINKCLGANGHPAELVLKKLSKFITDNSKNKSTREIRDEMFVEKEFDEPGSCKEQMAKFDDLTKRFPFLYRMTASSDDEESFGAMLRYVGEEAEVVIKCDELFVISMWGQL